MTEIFYKVTHNPTEMGLKISYIMEKCDLGIDKISVSEEFSWKTPAKVDREYIDRMADVLKAALIETGSMVYSVEYSHCVIT
jgi:hypothetical protein